VTNRRTTGARRAAVAALAIATAATAAARGDEKFVALDQTPKPRGLLKVAPGGDRLYFQGPRHLVFDAEGRLIDQYAAPEGSSPVALVPLPGGGFVGADSGRNGHLALYRDDGTVAKVLVAKGNDVARLRAAGPGANTPAAVAVDAKARLIFAVDMIEGPRDRPNPAFGRLAVFDLDGKFVREINRYDPTQGGAAAADARRHWYEDVAVDPARRRVYLASREPTELLAFDYGGKPLGKVAGVGHDGVAVLPDGRVAAAGGSAVKLFTPDLRPAGELPVPASSVGPYAGVLDVEADAKGRLYATIGDPAVTFLRWSADLKRCEAIGPRFVRLSVQFPAEPVAIAGRPWALKVGVTGRPAPPKRPRWRVLARPSDGSEDRWLPWKTEARGETLTATPPASARGLFDVAVHLGDGPIRVADRADDPTVVRTIAVAPPGVSRSVTVLSATGRHAFRRGEPIPIQLATRGPDPGAVACRLTLERGKATLAAADVKAVAGAGFVVPGALTARLAPGRHRLRPSAAGHEGYPLTIDVAADEPDSPMQRVIYHEFDSRPITMEQVGVGDTADRLAFVRDSTRMVAALGFTRETDRLLYYLAPQGGQVAWDRGVAPAKLAATALPPPDATGVPGRQRSNWEAEAYLDQAVRRGVAYDTQLFQHVGSVPVAEARLRPPTAILQRAVQWLGRWPSFYGVNYHDEFRFAGTVFGGKNPEDLAALKAIRDERFGGRPGPGPLRVAARRLYDRLGAAVRLADPDAHLTCTPMWQTSAVDGLYAPVVWQGMSESYTHYLSEGFQSPWWPAHAVDFWRRPGLPAIGVTEVNQGVGAPGDVYIKNAMLMAARGVQGVGLRDVRPFDSARAADAFRAVNRLARDLGPVFGGAPPVNEGAILYSLAQDSTERLNLNGLGTPHWERAFELYGVGLMAGVPMEIVYEEDISAGALLDGARPRVPMLFLVGQAQPLPGPVRDRIAAFQKAGGRVFTDADSAPLPGATKLDLDTRQVGSRYDGHNFNGDGLYPTFQPVFERSARALFEAVGRHRRFPIETDDPWVTKNVLDGGAIRYVMLAGESGPYPWDAGATWSLGARYSQSFLPKTVAATWPASPGVVYDAFDHAIIAPKVTGSTATIAADLRQFPARLYALAPAALGPPKVSARPEGDALSYRVEVVDEAGRPIAARVPLRIRLVDGSDVALEVVRGTEADGTFRGSVTPPANAAKWTLEVTELLGGKGSSLSAPSGQKLGPLVEPRPAGEPLRADRVRALLESCDGSLTLSLARPDLIPTPRARALAEALRTRGVTLREGKGAPGDAPGTFLAAAVVHGRDKLGPLLDDARTRGLFEYPLTDQVPGPGRGFFTAVFSPSAPDQHAIALVGGDADGIGAAVDAFVAWLKAPEAAAPKPSKPAPGPAIEGKAGAVAPVARLGEMVGVRLSAVRVAADGKHLAVAAEGYTKNLALVEDQGTSARVVRAERVGQSPATESLFVAADGGRFGASARDVSRAGQAFHLVDASGRRDVFDAFGDLHDDHSRFACSDRGDAVIATGPYGVVCWKEKGASWSEAWAIDYWKEFRGLDWPVQERAERLPQFHAVIPSGADYALVLFGETTNNHWITPENVARVWVAAVALADGKERWRFEVPMPQELLFPTLVTSPDGSRCLVRLQVGGFGRVSYKLYTVAGGKEAGSWDAPGEPVAAEVADGDGRVALSYKRRLLEVRDPDGRPRVARAWPSQPVAFAFAPDPRAVYVADEEGLLSRLEDDGHVAWWAEVGCLAALAAHGDRIYAAGRDGRLRCFTADGKALWTLDCNPAMNPDAQPMATTAKAGRPAEATVHSPKRAATASARAPKAKGPDLLRSGKATLTVGGTVGFGSAGNVEVKPAELTDGRLEMPRPWLNHHEAFWDGHAGRQVWAEVAFPKPTAVRTLTVHEDPKFPDSWPTQALVEVWDAKSGRWRTAAVGLFLRGPTNTYDLNLKDVTKLRYVPWSSYYRNFHTAEIEVR
jgi:hypothetical protein